MPLPDDPPDRLERKPLQMYAHAEVGGRFLLLARGVMFAPEQPAIAIPSRLLLKVDTLGFRTVAKDRWRSHYRTVADPCPADAAAFARAFADAKLLLTPAGRSLARPVEAFDHERECGRGDYAGVCKFEQPDTCPALPRS